MSTFEGTLKGYSDDHHHQNNMREMKHDSCVCVDAFPVTLVRRFSSTKNTGSLPIELLSRQRYYCLASIL